METPFGFPESEVEAFSRKIVEAKASIVLRDFDLLRNPEPYRINYEALQREDASEIEKNIAALDYAAGFLLDPGNELVSKTWFIASDIQYIAKSLLKWYGVANPDLWRTYLLHNYNGPEHLGDSIFKTIDSKKIDPEKIIPTAEEWDKIFKIDGWRVTGNATRLASWFEKKLIKKDA